MRFALAFALMLAAAPALAGQMDRQPLLNITQGSPTTPDGVALLTLAETSLATARAAADRGDASAAVQELRRTGDGFIRVIAAIAANGLLAAKSGAIRQADADRVDACAGGLIESADALGEGPTTIVTSLDRLRSGADADGDGAIGWSERECGLVQLRQMIAQMTAGGA